MTSQDTGRGWVCRMGALLHRPAGEGCPGHCGSFRHRPGELHEGGVLLEEGGVLLEEGGGHFG